MKEKREKDPSSSLKLGIFPDEDDQNKENLRFLFFQSSKMKETLSQFGDVIFIDGTYKLVREKYVLFPITVLDQFQKTLTVGYFFVSDELHFTLSHAFEYFIKENDPNVIKNIKIVITDKDVNQINILQKLLPQAHFILCNFHVQKTIKSEVHKIKLSSKDQFLKTELKKNFDKLLYSKTDSEYNKTWKETFEICNKSENLMPFYDYLSKNWHSVRHLWSWHKLSYHNHFNSYTNNRAENQNRQIKTFIPLHSKFSVALIKLDEMINLQFENNFRMVIERQTKKFNPSNCDLIEKEIMIKCDTLVHSNISKKVLKELKIALEKFKSDKVYEGVSLIKNQTNCTKPNNFCPIRTYQIPCRHLLYTKLMNDEEVIDR